MKKIKYIINILLALLISPFYYYKLNNKELWIIGFGNNLYENNLKVFNEYLLKNGKICFVVIDKNSEHKKLLKKNKILIRGSIQAYVYFLYSKVLIFDTSNSDIAPGVLSLNKKAIKVYISHGMEGLKKLPDNYFESINADIICSVSDFEKNLKIRMGASKENVYVTGYPRHDICDKKIGGNDVLIFFTWRPWFETDKKSLEEYLEIINRILQDDELNRSLRDKNSILYINIHAGAKKYISKKLLENLSNIRVLNKEKSLSEILITSKLLITDYSSISWDFFKLDLPVFFYQFDREIYEKKNGLILDVKKEKLGVDIINYKDLREKIITTLNLNTFYSRLEKKEQYFRFEDRKNCERVKKLIDKTLRQNRRLT